MIFGRQCEVLTKSSVRSALSPNEAVLICETYLQYSALIVAVFQEAHGMTSLTFGETAVPVGRREDPA